ncbi:hypothetical protein CKF54_02430 [Psittacicella hinzii]|uniref:Peptidase S26 domain-containing protein n=1 Tax=Psittacicella hinzii TaxID=2028575 RepID=A0A3A1Y901_9GAMM|nr:S26 family signal peptidase [Psittacicella hinzii]RIY33679.1 hypothetical protein CKF54_02430 [Psittacicella hinzii]
MNNNATFTKSNKNKKQDRQDRKPNRAWYRKLALLLGAGGVTYALTAYFLPQLLHLGIDPQKTTSIVAGRFYFSSPLLEVKERGVLSVYASWYGKLSPAQQLQMRCLSKDLSNRRDFYRQLNTWLYQQEVETRTRVYFGMAKVQVDLYDLEMWQYVYGAQWADLTIGSLPALMIEKEAVSLPTANLPMIFQEVKAQEHLNRMALLQQDLYVFTNTNLIKSLEANTKFVKYLIAYPQDFVDLTLEGLFVNGIFIKELPEVIVQRLEEMPLQERRLVLAEGQYWMLGDDPTSIDSVYFGAVSKDKLNGKVFWFW